MPSNEISSFFPIPDQSKSRPLHAHILQQVCDYRCGTGIYGDLNCNWRGLGQTCRFCFQDAFQASLADEIAISSGSRVVLCATHEPPTSGDGVPRGGAESSLALPSDAAVAEAPDLDAAAQDALASTESVSLDEMCAFIAGYYEFYAETNVSVSSVLHFMPGMRVGIATNPGHFHVFNR